MFPVYSRRMMIVKSVLCEACKEIDIVAFPIYGFTVSADMNNSNTKHSRKAPDSNILLKYVLVLCQRLKGLDVMEF
jgi:hypothetical protein